MLSIADENYYNDMIDKSQQVLDDLGIKYSKKILWSTFNRNRTWGVCINDYSGFYRIKITEKLISSRIDKSVCNTIIHELLHTCEGCMSHTGLWKEYAEKINSSTGYSIKRLTPASEIGIVPDYKYKVICKACGSVAYYNSNNKFIKDMGVGYLCGNCSCNDWEVYKSNGDLLWSSHAF